MTQNNLGIAYRYLSDVRDKEVNINKAIEAFKEVLTIYTKKDFPIIHAKVKKNLESVLKYTRAVKDLPEKE